MNTKKYDDIKDTISRFKRVMVTGPHGAGNKITAKIIEHDFGLKYIRMEYPWSHEDYWSDNAGLKRQLEDIRESNENYVLFTPSSSGHLHRITEYLDDTLVVFTHKNSNEIDIYTERNSYLKNATHNYESLVYSDVIINDYPEYVDLLTESIEDMTWKLWRDVQRDSIPHWVDVEHSSLESHPLFIPREQRKDFKAWQTMLNQKGHN
jgi:hypothetical protein|tara:strand:+ start:1478 stop:2098 length:621 start_codon:yes stop_codon:yes gene_type:complete